MRRLTDKERFYELCEKTGIDYPDTFVYKPSMGQDFELPFGGPFIVKPANSVTYWQHPFAEQKKVFKLDKLSQVYSTVKAITDAGYTDSIIIQNCIPGDDSYMRVLTSYSDRNGKVKMMCLGHVLLEEHTPHGIGNHAVIITEENKELMDRFKALLEELPTTDEYGPCYVSGFQYTTTADFKNADYKVKKMLTEDGKKFNMAKKYKVALNSYVYSTNKTVSSREFTNHYITTAEALIKYLEGQSAVDYNGAHRVTIVGGNHR